MKLNISMKILMFKNEKKVKIGDLVSVIDDDLKGKISAFKGNLVQIEDRNTVFIMTLKKTRKVVLHNHNIYDDISITAKRKPLPKFLKKSNSTTVHRFTFRKVGE